MTASNWPLLGFGLYMAFVFLLAWFSSRVIRSKEFVSEYFLGSRNLGMWAFALTFAATNASGGSFMGFPSLIYTHGWVLALWIASYMVVPIIAMGLLGKQLNQVARKGRAVTVPEMIKERFGSPGAGLTASLLILLFMFFYLLAQFKAGALIMTAMLEEVEVYQRAVRSVAGLTTGLPWVGQTDADYLLCLMVFAVAVIWYTTYGGFRAVVWTDVMQGLVMVLGVVVLLWFAFAQVGGLRNATEQMARMTPPEHGLAILKVAAPHPSDLAFRKGTWIETRQGEEREVFRTGKLAMIPAGQTESQLIPVIRITTPEEVERIAADITPVPVTLEVKELEPYRFGAGEQGVYLKPPGPHPKQEIGFLTIWMGMSFFVFWAFGGAGQPSNMVRLMAFKDSGTLRRAMAMVSVYYTLIYFPLVLIFCCARVLMPGMEIDSDRVMPQMAIHVTTSAGFPWLAGLLVAAPFAAVMSSVDSFLLLVSSALVRDLYQGRINPAASEAKIKRLTYWVTCLVGIAAVLGTLNPPKYLQDLVVFSTSGLAASFLVPVLLGLYWPRMNGAGAVAGMLGGCITHLLLYVVGYLMEGRFAVYQLLGFQPFIWDLIGSAICAVGVALATRPPERTLIRRFFSTQNHEPGSPT